MEINIQGSQLTNADKEQLAILFKNAATTFEADMAQRYGKTVAANYKVYVSNTDPVPAKLQEKTATPTTSSQNITADSTYDGLSKVVVSAVTAAIDENIVAGNIKKDVVILGVTGTYEGE